MFLYVEQYVAMALQSCLGLEELKNKEEKCTKSGKKIIFAVRMEWVKIINLGAPKKAPHPIDIFQAWSSAIGGN